MDVGSSHLLAMPAAFYVNTLEQDPMRAKKSGASEKLFKERINHLVKTRTRYTESFKMFTTENPPPKVFFLGF